MGEITATPVYGNVCWFTSLSDAVFSIWSPGVVRRLENHFRCETRHGQKNSEVPNRRGKCVAVLRKKQPGCSGGTGLLVRAPWPPARFGEGWRLLACDGTRPRKSWVSVSANTKQRMGTSRSGGLKEAVCGGHEVDAPRSHN